MLAALLSLPPRTPRGLSGPLTFCQTGQNHPMGAELCTFERALEDNGPDGLVKIGLFPNNIVII